MTEARVRFVDTYVVRPSGEENLEILVLRRSQAGRCPGSWEIVHGTIEPGETPVQASLRETMEETGFTPARLYNLSRVEMFYQHRDDEIALIPAFVAFVEPHAEPRLSVEHEGSEWLAPEAAIERVAWPRERRGLEDIARLFRTRDAGLLEDVLRVC